jgi:hypothetical protein
MRAAVGWLVGLALLTGCGAHRAGTPEPGTVTDSRSPSDSVSDGPSESLSDTDSAGPSDGTTGFVTVQPRTSAPHSSVVNLPTAGLAACAPPYLTLAVHSGSSGASHAGYLLVFTNTGQIACAMTGYPGVAILDSKDRQIIQASRTPNGYLGGLRGSKPPAIGLPAGGTASALLEGLLFDPRTSRGCPTERALLSTPPNTTTPMKVAVLTRICGQVQIHPMVPGSAGSQP